MKNYISNYFTQLKSQDPISEWKNLLLSNKSIYPIRSKGKFLTLIFTDPVLFRSLYTFLFFIKCIICTYIDQNNYILCLLFGEIHFQLGFIGKMTNILDGMANLEVFLLRVCYYWLQINKNDSPSNLISENSCISFENKMMLKSSLKNQLLLIKIASYYLCYSTTAFYLLLTIYNIYTGKNVLEYFIWFIWGSIFIFICFRTSPDIAILWGLSAAQFEVLKYEIGQLIEDSEKILKINQIRFNPNSRSENNLCQMKLINTFDALDGIDDYCKMIQKKFSRSISLFNEANEKNKYMISIITYLSIPFIGVVFLNSIKIFDQLVGKITFAIGIAFLVRLFYTQKLIYHLDSTNATLFKKLHSILARKSELNLQQNSKLFFFNNLTELLHGSNRPFTIRSLEGYLIDGPFMIDFYGKGLSMFIILSNLYDLT